MIYHTPYDIISYTLQTNSYSVKQIYMDYFIITISFV